MKTLHTTLPRLTVLAMIFVTCLQVLPALAAELVVTRYFSGLWDQPHQENQGILLQIVDSTEADKKAVAYWFNYGDDLESAWFIGIGQVEGPQVVLTVYEVSGVGFMETTVPGADPVEAIGSMILTFHNCNHGTASYDIGDGDLESGEFEIKRLAGLYNSRCSGGISDDTPAHAKPLKLEVDLEPAREGVDGSGKAKFWERVDRSDFHVMAEGLADGDYGLQVCGQPRGTLTILGGEGALLFRSPGADGKELLTFDPRGCLIELHDGVGAALSSGDKVLTARTDQGQGPGSGHNGPAELSAALENTGEIDGAEGSAQYREKMNSTEFEIEIRGVPGGDYALDVDGSERGLITVPSGNGNPKGRLRFSEPPKEGWEPLGFDPRGLLIEVRDGSDVILETFFPEE